jgi:hypothetical protein
MTRNLTRRGLILGVASTVPAVAMSTAVPKMEEPMNASVNLKTTPATVYTKGAVALGVQTIVDAKAEPTEGDLVAFCLGRGRPVSFGVWRGWTGRDSNGRFVRRGSPNEAFVIDQILCTREGLADERVEVLGVIREGFVENIYVREAGNAVSDDASDRLDDGLRWAQSVREQGFVFVRNGDPTAKGFDKFSIRQDLLRGDDSEAFVAELKGAFARRAA